MFNQQLLTVRRHILLGALATTTVLTCSVCALADCSVSPTGSTTAPIGTVTDLTSIGIYARGTASNVPDHNAVDPFPTGQSTKSRSPGFPRNPFATPVQPPVASTGGGLQAEGSAPAPSTPDSPRAPAPAAQPTRVDGLSDTSPSGLQAVARKIVPASQYASFAKIISHESGWRLTATNRSSLAYGLGQALPGSKMASVGSDWRTSPTTQITWALQYMDSRYGSPDAAWAFWSTHHWY